MSCSDKTDKSVQAVDSCCLEKKRPLCRSVGATECILPKVRQTLDEELFFEAQCGGTNKLCAALLLTGHMRTYMRTAKSVVSRVVNANHKRYDFDFVVATYENQDARKPRFRDRTNHSTSYESTVHSQMLWNNYHRYVQKHTSPFKAAWIHVFDEDEIGAVLPRAILQQAPHLSKIKRLKDENEMYMINRIKRSLALVQQGIHLVNDLCLKRGRPYDLVFRLRPDIELLASVPLDEVRQTMWDGLQPLDKRPFNHHARSRLVLPVTYDPRGGLNIRAKQLSTRPCARNGTLRPEWVQDHMAIASMATIIVYARFYHAFLKPNIFSAHVETALAKYLYPERISVSCLGSIRYTVVR